MSTLITNSNELTHFSAVFSKRDLAVDVAPRLSCVEVEALAGLLRALGQPATAAIWVQEHATEDAIRDAGYHGDALEYMDPIHPQDDLRCDSCP